MIIDKFSFDIASVEDVRGIEHYGSKVGDNWPVVYVLNNNEEAYVGETVNAATRMKQHLVTPAKKQLTEIRIITDKDYNKSVILDLESFLIKHMSADGKYNLINGNHGIQDHEYYQKSQYEERFREVWNKLKSHGIVSQSIDDIENSELFKYSPYKSLGEEQKEAEIMILRALAECQNNKEKATILVNGGAGTGKTILAIYLMKLIADINNTEDHFVELTDYIDEDAESVFATDCLRDIKKIGIVLPQKSLRESLTSVFKTIRSLKPSMVLNTTDVVKDYLDSGEKFDLLIVDEAHRLKCRDKGHLAFYTGFDNANKALGLDKMTGTELDWMFMCSKNVILFRDEKQTVRPCDIDTERFNQIIDNYQTDNSVKIQIPLETQWRCKGGNDYIKYIHNIFYGRQQEYQEIENYDLRLYEDVDAMVNDIKELDKEYGLCRVAAGYAWEWQSKKDPSKYDIFIGDNKYRWNSTDTDWVVSKNAINEIGCIHTVQGYDLNYLGVIIGKELYYDTIRGEIRADKNNYHDQQGKSGCAFNHDLLRDYLINIYLTLMTRGIRGTYVYVCDDALREYMKQFIKAQE